MVYMKQKKPPDFCKLCFVIGFNNLRAHVMPKLYKGIHNSNAYLNCRGAVKNGRQHSNALFSKDIGKIL